MRKSDELRATESALRIAQIAEGLRTSGGGVEDYFRAMKAAYELGFFDGSQLTEESIIDSIKEMSNYENN